MPYVRNTIRVKVPNRSGFDKTHRNSGTMTCGTITPILFDEVVPSTRLSLRLPITVQLPPLASDTYMNLKLKVEAFFVPMRLLCKSFEDFFSDNAPYEGAMGSTGIYTDLVPRVPYFVTGSGYISTGPGSLADYLGVRSFDAQVGALNALPFAAYHLVYQEWYRNPRVQKAPFVPALGAASAVRQKIYSMPSTYFADSTSAASLYQGYISPAISFSSVSDTLLNDGVSIFALRQRNFGQDYFTGARLTAQQGPAVTVDTAVVPDPVTAGDQTRMTISALRAANSLQMFKERNMLPSSRYIDQVKARYGATLSDGVAQRPICIGTGSYDVLSTGISQTASAGTGTGSVNPFDSVAAQYGRAYASGSDFIIKDFTANEPGYILVNATLVPEVTYNTGLDRMFLRYTGPGSITDMANNLLQNVGDQPVYQWELAGNSGTYFNHIVGYQDRFADFMYKSNSVHGLLSASGVTPGSPSLSSFVLQRGFTGASPLDLSSAFLEIPKNFLDPVFAVSSGVSGFSAWYDAMLQYKVSMPLAEFSIPSLQDPAYEHGQTISLRRNGQIF